MIDTCDPAIACWSDDGETFVVKDPAKFERSIIPQFFKHSKFSSFVRVSPKREMMRRGGFASMSVSVSDGTGIKPIIE